MPAKLHLAVLSLALPIPKVRPTSIANSVYDIRHRGQWSKCAPRARLRGGVHPRTALVRRAEARAALAQELAALVTVC